MATKSFPLNNPLQKCDYCDYSTHSEEALRVHKNKYHEAVVAEEGERARERGGSPYAGTYAYLIKRGYKYCVHDKGLCPGPQNIVAQLTCKWEGDCPFKEEAIVGSRRA